MTSFYSSIKYTYTISNNTVTFLSLLLKLNSNNIKSCVHFRPTDSRNYLLFSSSHPPSCIHSFPFSQILRIKRCYSDNNNNIAMSNQVASHFSSRQFPKCIIESANEDVHSILREYVLMPSLRRFHRIAFLCLFHSFVLQFVRSIASF